MYVWHSVGMFATKLSYTSSQGSADFSIRIRLNDVPIRSIDELQRLYAPIYNNIFGVKKEVRSRYKNRESWLTEGLKSSIKHTNKLFVNQIKIIIMNVSIKNIAINYQFLTTS